MNEKIPFRLRFGACLLSNGPLLLAAVLLLLLGIFFDKTCTYIGISLAVAFLLSCSFQLIFESVSRSSPLDESHQDKIYQNRGNRGKDGTSRKSQEKPGIPVRTEENMTDSQIQEGSRAETEGTPGTDGASKTEGSSETENKFEADDQPQAEGISQTEKDFKIDDPSKTDEKARAKKRSKVNDHQQRTESKAGTKNNSEADGQLEAKGAPQTEKNSRPTPD